MKRFFIMLAAVVLTATTLSAQIVPGMKYRDLKNMYNPRQYVRNAADPYSKGWSAVASAVVPGLGQMICKEAGRGIGILAGDVALGVAGHVCASKFTDYLAKDANGKYIKENGDFVYTDEKAAMPWGYAALGILAVDLGYYIWNICDASRVAKVKNMYYQDLQGKQRPMGFNLYPSVSPVMTADGTAAVAGMTLSMKF